MGPATETPEAEKAQGRSQRRILIRFAVGMTIWSLLWGVLMFGAAGTLAWPRGWLAWGLNPVSLIIMIALLRRLNPGILAVRMRRRKPQGFDRIILRILRLFSVSIPLVAGLDAVRFGWSAMAPWWIAPGLALHCAGNALIVWTMAANRFLEPTVRIQSEYGHQVITGGPYRFVRHPMYLGGAIMIAGWPLVLGTWWTFAPVAASVLTLAVRITFEERLLRRELPGYEDYVRRTRWRLLPGVW